MINRDEQREDFISASGYSNWNFAPLTADASARQYYRGTSGQSSLILMDAPPKHGENIEPFLDVTKRLHGFDLKAPEILVYDIVTGFILMEDFGDNLVATHCKNHPQDEDSIYRSAIDVLAVLKSQSNRCDLAPYDRDVYHQEAALVLDWYCAPLTTSARRAFFDGLDAALGHLSPHPPVLTLRDYHAENLIWRSDMSGTDRLGLLDYQDALAGHPAYDLVSLIEDARRPIAKGLHEKLVQYAAKCLIIPVESLRQDVAILGAQRNLKIIGIFARLFKRDGKAKYPPMIPHVFDLLQTDLAHPTCKDLQSWCARHLPTPNEDRISAILGTK
ncbi:MAG: phosphotransferase [Pseudomonadota bacterium]